MLGGGKSIVKMTDTVFLIVYLPNPLAKGFTDTVLVTRSTPFYEHHLDGTVIPVRP